MINSTIDNGKCINSVHILQEWTLPKIRLKWQKCCPPEKVEEFSQEHIKMLKNTIQDNFFLKHQITIFAFRKIDI